MQRRGSVPTNPERTARVCVYELGGAVIFRPYSSTAEFFGDCFACVSWKYSEIEQLLLPIFSATVLPQYTYIYSFLYRGPAVTVLEYHRDQTVLGLIILKYSVRVRFPPYLLEFKFKRSEPEITFVIYRTFTLFHSTDSLRKMKYEGRLPCRARMTTPTGAILPEPKRTRFSLLGVVCSVMIGLVIGTTLSKMMANYLEEKELFVPSDDDDDDDDD